MAEKRRRDSLPPTRHTTSDRIAKPDARRDLVPTQEPAKSMQKLTEEQRKHFSTIGYLKLEGALSPDEVAYLSAEVDRIRAEPGFEPVKRAELPIGHYEWLPHTKDLDLDGFMDRRDLLTYGQAFIDLIDRPNVFDLIVDIMGPYLALSMTQAIIRASDDFPGYTHTDGGEGLRRIRVTESSWPLAMKVMYLLTDIDEENSGNFTVFPGSHNQPFPYDADPRITPYSPGAVQLTGKAGDAILFQHSLWHGPSQNRSGKGRKTILYNYCQLFMRQYDFDLTPEIASRCTPRQRRLLGDLGYDFRPGSYFYAPVDQVDVICNP
ncbi:MAG: phytanoyl-CoA dioxygenase family protein [Gammaproteobacteria bacterium]|nr:phytanoyl-CoA dioxygenase family protein [Gammaproteobacteria bacterium]